MAATPQTLLLLLSHYELILAETTNGWRSSGRSVKEIAEMGRRKGVCGLTVLRESSPSLAVTKYDIIFTMDDLL